MSIIRYTNWDGLLNTGVSDFLLQDSELTACKNTWVYKIGKLEKVPGYTQIGSQVVDTKSINLLHHYFDTANSVNYMIAGSDSGTAYTFQYRTTGNFATVGSISTTLDGMATAQPCAANYLGKTFIVGYKSGTTFFPNCTITGTTFSATDPNISGMPQGKFVVVYRDLLYVLNTYVSGTRHPSRAYYSDEPTAGAIAWTGVATNNIEFGYDDGDEITGVAECQDRLIVFKQNSIWKWDESSVIKISDVGCDSHRSIKRINGMLYWTNRYGCWVWNGGAPVLVSAKAQEFFDAVNQATLANQVACVYNGNEYRVFIGTVVVNGETYTNAWFCWNTDREKCYIRCTYDVAKSACNYTESSIRRAYFGNDDGYVMKFANKGDSIYSDNTQPIDSFFETKYLDHGVPEDTKFTSKITLFTNYASNMKCAIKKDNITGYEDSTIQISSGNISEEDMNHSANRYKYRFYEAGTGKSWEFEGFCIDTQDIEQ